MADFQCVPVCKKCRESDSCTMVWSYTPPMQQDWKPDRMALKILDCGHKSPIIPTVLGLVNPTHVQCSHGCGWQVIRKKEHHATASEVSEQEIPF